MNGAHRDAANLLFDMSSGIPIPPMNTQTRNLQLQNEEIINNVNGTDQMPAGLCISHRTESTIGQSGSISSVTIGSNNTSLTKSVDICSEVNGKRNCELTLCMVRK